MSRPRRPYATPTLNHVSRPARGVRGSRATRPAIRPELRFDTYRTRAGAVADGLAPCRSAEMACARAPAARNFRRTGRMAMVSMPPIRGAEGEEPMKMRVDLLRWPVAALAGLLVAMPAASAADYPNKPVRWVVGYPPGGTTDILARLIGSYLSEKLGQQFVIENKPGAGNNLGGGGGRERAARRLHGAVGQSGQWHQCFALQEAVVQLHPRYRADRRHLPGAERDGGQPRRCRPRPSRSSSTT